MLHRLAVLERVVSRLSKSLPSDLVSSGSGEIESPSSTSSSSSLRKSQPKDAPRPIDSILIGNAPDGKPKSSIRSSYGSGSTDEDVAMMLEDFAMGHRVNRSRAARNLEDETPSAYSYSAYGSQQAGPITCNEIYERTVHSMPTPVSAVERFAPQLGLPDRHPLSLLIDPSTNVISRLVSALPNQTHRATLVHFYVGQVVSCIISQLIQGFSLNAWNGIQRSYMFPRFFLKLANCRTKSFYWIRDTIRLCKLRVKSQFRS